MDLSAYLLNGVVEATAPPNETEADARTRGDAIVEMVCAFDPRDAMETMIACHCVMLQFLLNAAMRDASNVNLEPAVMIKARAAAMSISRTLHQWVTKFEKIKKRNEAGAAETREAAASVAAAAPAAVKSPAQKSPNSLVTPPRQPVPSPADRPAIHVPVPNGRAAAEAAPPGTLPAAATTSFPSRAPWGVSGGRVGGRVGAGGFPMWAHRTPLRRHCEPERRASTTGPIRPRRGYGVKDLAMIRPVLLATRKPGGNMHHTLAGALTLVIANPRVDGHVPRSPGPICLVERLWERQMAVQRSKAASTHGNINIWALVADWYQAAQVWYVAHAFLNNGGIVRLRPAISAVASNSSASHPDQQYWRVLTQNVPQRVNAIVNSLGPIMGTIARIDIDCKLMPCNSQFTGCLYQVPAFMANLYNLNGIPIRFFSHADEGMGGGLSTKRVISTTTGVANGVLTTAYNNHDGWGWVP